MRWSCLFAAAVAVTAVPRSFSQETLCNPCVDGPEMFERRIDFTTLDAPRPVTAEEMRRLGVTSVEAMLQQLGTAAAAPQSSPFVCPRSLPSEGPSFQFDDAAEDWSDGWYGTRSFAVTLSSDATYEGSDKFFWYSEGLRPDQVGQLEVSIRRLDEGPVTAVASTPTNARFSGRWHVLTGIDFPDAGCWEITGRYQGQLLTFVVESTGE